MAKTQNEGFIMFLRKPDLDLYDWLLAKPLRWAIFTEMARRARRTSDGYNGLNAGEFWFSEMEHSKFGLAQNQRGKIARIILGLIRSQVIQKVENKIGNNNCSVYRLINNKIFDINVDNREVNREQTESKQRANREQVGINNNDNNDNNYNNESKSLCDSVANSETFVLEDWFRGLKASSRKDLRIIADYLLTKGIKFESKAQAEQELKRNLRAAGQLAAWQGQAIKATIQWLEDNELSWTLETIVKHVAEQQHYGSEEYGVVQGAGENEWPEIPAM